MANSLISVQEVARIALPRLMENLVFPNLIHKDFSDAFSNKLGDTIRVRKPIVFEAKEFDPSQGTTAQDIVENSVDVQLNKIATVDIDISALEGATGIDDIGRQFIEPAAAALAAKINSDGLELYKYVYNHCGTAGTTPNSLGALAEVRAALNRNNVPVAPRCAVWDVEADAALTTVDALVNAEKCGSTQALRDGSIGRVFRMDNYMSQGVREHVSSVTAATAVKVASNVSAGATKLNLTATTLTGKLIRGDILDIDGKSYVVTADTADASSNAISNVSVSPALPALSANTSVAIVGSHTANLAFHPMAFSFVTRPLAKPAGVESYVTNYNGISLRVVNGYDMKYKKESMSMDVLYGFKTVYPELAVRVLG